MTYGLKNLIEIKWEMGQTKRRQIVARLNAIELDVPKATINSNGFIVSNGRAMYL